jgi:hypothetical protein
MYGGPQAAARRRPRDIAISSLVSRIDTLADQVAASIRGGGIGPGRSEALGRLASFADAVTRAGSATGPSPDLGVGLSALQQARHHLIALTRLLNEHPSDFRPGSMPILRAQIQDLLGLVLSTSIQLRRSLSASSK